MLSFNIKYIQPLLIIQALCRHEMRLRDCYFVSPDWFGTSFVLSAINALQRHHCLSLRFISFPNTMIIAPVKTHTYSIEALCPSSSRTVFAEHCLQVYPGHLSKHLQDRFASLSKPFKRIKASRPFNVYHSFFIRFRCKSWYGDI